MRRTYSTDRRQGWAPASMRRTYSTDLGRRQAERSMAALADPAGRPLPASPELSPSAQDGRANGEKRLRGRRAWRGKSLARRCDRHEGTAFAGQAGGLTPDHARRPPGSAAPGHAAESPCRRGMRAALQTASGHARLKWKSRECFNDGGGWEDAGKDLMEAIVRRTAPGIGAPPAGG